MNHRVARHCLLAALATACSIGFSLPANPSHHRHGTRAVWQPLTDEQRVSFVKAFGPLHLGGITVINDIAIYCAFSACDHVAQDVAATLRQTGARPILLRPQVSPKVGLFVGAPDEASADKLAEAIELAVGRRPVVDTRATPPFIAFGKRPGSSPGL